MSIAEEPNVNPTSQNEMKEVVKEKEETLGSIREEFLKQKIPICVKLNKNDIAGFTSPNPYYVSPV